MTSSTVDLSDPGLWSRPDLPEIIEGLRREGDIHLTETLEDGPVWSVLSHGLTAEVLKNTAVFSSEGGSLLGSTTEGGQPPVGARRMMALTDPPRHRHLRTPVTSFFSPAAVRGSAPGIGSLAREIVGNALQKGPVDLVEVVSALPLAVMCDLLAVRAEDRAMVLRVCDAAFLGTSAEERRSGHQQLIPYLVQQVMERRGTPGTDVISAMANYRINGRLMPVEDVVLNLDNIVVGGVQTVRHTAAMSLLTLVERPRLWERLAEGGPITDEAVDELLRWTSVGLHTLRTLTRDTDLGGRRLRRGDRVAVWLWAANRDPAVFDRPGNIVLDRSPNRHLALGIGAHYCIGAPLAKAELAALLSAILERVRFIEPDGPHKYNRSIINFGLDHFPVHMVPR